MPDDAPTDLSVDLSNRLFFRLYQSANMMHKTGTRALEAHRITTQQWAIVGALSRPGLEGGMTINGLAGFLLVSRQNLAGVLSRLEAQAIVERIVDARDSRSRRVRLTEAGRRLWFERLRPEIILYYEAALRGFSTEDKVHTLHYLSKLLDNLKRLDPAEES
jgi:MarR family transcriptional regulator, organic hydroperoxide resistance regulator